MPRRLTDISIAAIVVPTSLRWPNSDLLTWARLREAVAGLREMLRALDLACQHVEQDQRLNPQDIKRQRIHLGEKALNQLADFQPLHNAENAVSKNVGDSEIKMQALLRKALDELHEGVNATRRAIIERCQIGVPFGRRA